MGSRNEWTALAPGELRVSLDAGWLLYVGHGCTVTPALPAIVKLGEASGAGSRCGHAGRLAEPWTCENEKIREEAGYLQSTTQARTRKCVRS